MVLIFIINSRLHIVYIQLSTDMEKIPFGFGGTILRPCMVPQLPFAKWWHEFSSVEVVQQEFSGLIDFSTNRIPCCLKLPNWWNILNHDLLTDVILTKFCHKIFRIPTKNIFLYLTIRPAQLLVILWGGLLGTIQLTDNITNQFLAKFWPV